MTFTIGGCFETNVLFSPMVLWKNSMPDPDLEISGGGGGGGVISQKIFSPFRPQFGLQNKGGLGPQNPPLDPPLKFITNRG